MKPLKIILTVLLLCAQLLSLLACTGQENAPDGEGTAAPDTKPAESKEPESTPLSNTYYKLTEDKNLNIAFVGGSITAGQGASSDMTTWTKLLKIWLRETFKSVKVPDNISGVHGTGSDFGVFRFEEDILNYAVPDLLFIEFTSNEGGGETVSRTNESLIRMMYEANPYVDIVFLYTNLSPSAPSRVEAQKLCDAYGLLSIDVGAAMTKKVQEEYGGDYSHYTPDVLHPNDAGYQFYFDEISEVFSDYLIDNPPETPSYVPHTIPEPVNEKGLMLHPAFLEPDDCAVFDDTFVREERELTYGVRGKTDHRYVTETEGGTFSFSFTGDAFGLLIDRREDVSDIEYSLDGGDFVFYAVDNGSYYTQSRLYLIEQGLADTEHTVVIRNVPSSAKTREEDGLALRLLKIAVNHP